MGIPINLDAERAELRRRLTRTFACFPSALAPVAEKLLARLDFGSAKPNEGWDGRFCPLVLLYPLLQAEGLTAVPAETLRELNLAHGLFLVHAILEDRELDRQMELSSGELLFNKLVGLRAQAALRSCAPGSEVAEWTDRLTDIYVEHQLARYDDFLLRDCSEDALSPPANLAFGRATLGCIAVVALGLLAGEPAGRIEEILNAFQYLAVALQWADDIDDWPEDFIESRENLLLHLAKRASGSAELPEKSRAGVASLNVRMLLSGVYAQAFDNGKALFAEAARRQRQLGCETLAGLIDEKARLLESRERDLVRRVGERVLLALDELPEAG